MTLLKRIGSTVKDLLVTEPESCETVIAKDWRTHFASKLSGHGLELGALQRPLAKHAGMTVDYCDKLPLPGLRNHYPEHNSVPLVSPDIVDDAETLATVKDNTYDFLIGAHLFEHLKNPLGGLKTWCRVVKPGGWLYLVVPDKRYTFDKLRTRTTIEHMILDFVKPSADRDYEHYLDYSTWVHGKRGYDALEDARQLHERDYSIHFHVFVPEDVLRLLEWFRDNVLPIQIVEGPSKAPGSDEFHFLIRVP